MTFTKSRTFRIPYEIGRNYTPRRHLLRIVRICAKAQMLIHSVVPPLPQKIIFDAFLGTPLCENCGLADGSMKSKLAFVRQPDSIPRKTAFSLRCYRSYPFARYHKTRIEKADWKQQHFQSAYLFVRQISFRPMPGLPQLKGRCTLPPFHKAHHLPTLPMRV